MDGWARLGSALAGGGMQRENAYNQGASQAARLQSALSEARQKRDAEIGRQSAARQAFDAGDNELGNAILQGFGTLAGLNSYAGGRQERGFKDEAMGLARAPDTDIGELNEMLMVMSGKPYDPTQVEGNVVTSRIDPNVAPVLTELGQAMAGAQKARAAASYASAGASNALAEKRRGGGGVSGPDGAAGEKPTSLSSTELEALFSSIDPDTGTRTFNANEYRRFLDFQRKRGIPNAQRAAQMFSTDFSNVGGGIELPPAEVAAEESNGLLASLFGGDKESGMSLSDLVTGKKVPAQQKQATDAAQPTTQEEYNALPSGTLYVDPDDGTLRRKR